ncbi:hypothetical protein EYB53_025120, partial [Candidatus Chloroploca sp. M-50]
ARSGRAEATLTRPARGAPWGAPSSQDVLAAHPKQVERGRVGASTWQVGRALAAPDLAQRPPRPSPTWQVGRARQP